MTYKEFLQNFALVFIVWEFIKLFIPHIIWKNAKVAWSQREIKERKGGNLRINLQKRNPAISMIGYAYLIFTLLLLFSKWWWVSLTLIALSSASVASIKPFIKRNISLNFQIWLVLFIDFIFSVALLSVVNPIIINYFIK